MTRYIFYVYAYLRKNGTPYYIGKGQEKRAFQRHLGFYPPKDKSRILFLETNLTEIGAFALERRYIRWYGRKDLGTGILHNKTDGGEGPSGAVRSPETLKRMSEVQKGKTSWNTGITWKKNRTINEESRQRMSQAQKGRIRGPMSAEHKQKIKESLQKHWTIKNGT